MYSYNAAFQVLATSSASAAQRIIQIVGTILPVGSVLDVGCARGTWPRVWQEAGCQDVLGVDGQYIDTNALEIQRERFITADLNQPIDLNRTFDLAECLEVAEHLPASRADSFVADLVRHAPAVLFSAATPGQGGEHHINEQPCSYWQAIFQRHGYVAVDCLRPLLARQTDIPHWYRYNLILYVRGDALDRLAPFARYFAFHDGQIVPDIAPLPYRARKLVIRCLPDWLCNRLSRWLAKRHAQRRDA